MSPRGRPRASSVGAPGGPYGAGRAAHGGRLASLRGASRRPRALPRLRAVALRRWAPVPPRARPGAREPRARRRARPDLRRHAGLPLQLVQLRLRASSPLRAGGLPAWCTAWTGRSAPTAGSTTARTRASRRSTRSSRTRPCSSRGTASRSTRELGISLRDPVVVRNTVDPTIFHPPERRDDARRPAGPRDRVELVAESAEGCRRARVARPKRRPDARVASRSSARLRSRSSSIRHVGPVDSDGVARLLREHDVYLAASRDDPCSNALLEALACGLPAAYLDSGGHPELVGAGGLPFAVAGGGA